MRMMESTSEETIVPSHSNQDLQNITSSSQPSPKQHSSPQMRGKGGGFVMTNSSSLTSQESSQGLSQVPMTSPRSQEDSAHERVSPDTSDTGDHSAEAEAEPRSIEISKGLRPLGKERRCICIFDLHIHVCNTLLHTLWYIFHWHLSLVNNNSTPVACMCVFQLARHFILK